ncbi:hypothetical protein C5L32_001745 [Lentilactobacillus buchneri]|uniref:Uncharacterized protein n=1 Tax=Lentilactobacillus buchneri DSM 20057 TaxID=1423728 RepID=A0A4R5NTE7_LENBU|nr:hypothetical protein Lbuc_0530 [Lentilactobacillus buchneri NRRL B-30929]TDG80145.1 hypothetical protein C5L32_001745 [Lentilactobacillus buchneri]
MFMSSSREFAAAIFCWGKIVISKVTLPGSRPNLSKQLNSPPIKKETET